jgi:hypothetical protein
MSCDRALLCVVMVSVLSKQGLRSRTDFVLIAQGRSAVF